jgi:hypothetical protein
VITGTAEPRPGVVAIYGYLDTSAACRAGREVQVFARYGEWTPRHVWGPGSWRVAGTVRTAADGTFTGTVSKPALWAAKLVARRENLGRRGHRHICGADAAGLGFQGS